MVSRGQVCRLSWSHKVKGGIGASRGACAQTFLGKPLLVDVFPISCALLLGWDKDLDSASIRWYQFWCHDKAHGQQGSHVALVQLTGPRQLWPIFLLLLRCRERWQCSVVAAGDWRCSPPRPPPPSGELSSSAHPGNASPLTMLHSSWIGRSIPR